jgi:phosphoglycolate phosphatase-like HAD superfamily hydrolase
MRSGVRFVLFDIDGTLLDSRGVGRRAIARAIRHELGEELLQRSYRLDGKTDPQIVAEVLAAAGRRAAARPRLVEAICSRYVEELRDELERTSEPPVPMPGVPSLLERLEREGGVSLGLLTGNLREGARLKLAAAGIAFERFRIGAFGSDSPDRPELPTYALRRAAALTGRRVPASELVVVGDTPADVNCGRLARARTIAVATGRFDAATLRSVGADDVFATLEDTEAVVRSILR